MKGNTVSVCGNITRDPEVRQTQSGRTVAQFGLAWNSSRKNQQGGYDDVPHFFEVKVWLSDAQAQAVLPKLRKGCKCAVIDGHLEYESWQDRQTGQNRSRVVIIADDPIQGLAVEPPRAAAAPAPQQQPAQYQPQQAAYAPQAEQQPQYQQPMATVSGGGECVRVPVAEARRMVKDMPSMHYSSIYDQDIPF